MADARARARAEERAVLLCLIWNCHAGEGQGKRPEDFLPADLRPAPAPEPASERLAKWDAFFKGRGRS